MATECPHVDQIRDATPSAEGCFKPGEDWGGCYVDQLMLENF